MNGSIRGLYKDLVPKSVRLIVRRSRRTVLELLSPADERARLRAVREAAQRDAVDIEHISLLIAFYLHETSNAIDVGANHGCFLAQMVRVAPLGRHLAFEPNPSLARDLLVRFPQVDVREMALSDFDGQAEFEVPTGHDALGSLKIGRDLGIWARRESGGTRTRVEVRRLDSVLPDGFVPSLIKVDVEGAETELFRGAEALIAEHKPVVVFEHVATGGADSDEIWEILVDRCGLRMFDIDGRGPLTKTDFVSCSATRGPWNWVAHS